MVDEFGEPTNLLIHFRKLERGPAHLGTAVNESAADSRNCQRTLSQHRLSREKLHDDLANPSVIRRCSADELADNLRLLQQPGPSFEQSQTVEQSLRRWSGLGAPALLERLTAQQGVPLLEFPVGFLLFVLTRQSRRPGLLERAERLSFAEGRVRHQRKRGGISPRIV